MQFKEIENTTHLNKCSYDIVVVGASLGGLRALEVLLASLSENFPLPIAIAQHRHKNADALGVILQRQCPLPLSEAEDKEAIAPGHIYLAPADYHLLVEVGRLALSTEAPVCHARPSIDVLFESAADAYGKRVIGVILTGASDDGAKGLATIKANGGVPIVQEPTTAQSPTMPSAAIDALQKQRSHSGVTTEWILPLSDIATLIVNLCYPALR